MTPELIKVLRKVKSLRALATSSNANEAATAAAQADKLMQKYRIDEAQLGAVPVGRDTDPLDIWKQIPPQPWKEELVRCVCWSYDVAYLYNEYVGKVNGRAAVHRHVVMCGAEGDLAMCRLMYRWIKRQAMDLARSEEREALRDAFRWGLVLAVAVALVRSKREAIENAPTTAALALRDRLATAQRRMREENPAVQPGAPATASGDRYDSAAVLRGYKAGEALELDKRRKALKQRKEN